MNDWRNWLIGAVSGFGGALLGAAVVALAMNGTLLLGNVSEALAALFTGAAFAATAWTLRLQQISREDDKRVAERRQAGRVSAIVDREPRHVRAGAVGVMVTVHNASDEPIFETRVSHLAYGTDERTAYQILGTLAPGQSETQMIAVTTPQPDDIAAQGRPTGSSRLIANMAERGAFPHFVDLAFTDSEGRHWVRTADGVLVRSAVSAARHLASFDRARELAGDQPTFSKIVVDRTSVTNL